MNDRLTGTLRDARVLIVGGGPFQLDILRAAKRLVREVWVVDADPRAPGMALADRAIALDFGRPEAVVELARRERFDGVATAASDAAIPAVAACVETCGLLGVDQITARRCRDKLQTVETLARAGLRVPRTERVLDVESARRAAEAVGDYPVVVKPRSGAGGRGVSIVRDASGMAAAVAKALKYAPAGGDCLVQQWLSGHSVGVEVFLWNGQPAAGFCMSDQYTGAFVSPVGHALPGDLGPDAQARVLSAVAAFCRALGASSGPFNFDLRYVRDHLWLVECNPRLGGNSITQLVRTAYSVDLAEATVLCALGEDPRPALVSTFAPQPCAARMFVARSGGVQLRPSAAVDAWRQRTEVLDLEIAAQNAQSSMPQVDEWAILGRCLVRGPTPVEAIELAQRVAEDVESAVIRADAAV